MTDPGPNEQSLELPEVSPSPPLTVARGPAPPALVVPGGWRIEGLPWNRAGGRPLRPSGASSSSSPPRSQTPIPASPTRPRPAVSSGGARPATWRFEQSLPFAVATYIEEMQDRYALPTVKQHLSALRALLDYLVVGQVLPAQIPPPPSAVPNTSSSRARPPCFPPARPAPCSTRSTSPSPPGLRDRALLATMVYSFARVGAVVGMNVEDYYRQGKRWWLRLHEKGGKFHQVPAHHNAEEYLDAYLEAAGIGNEKGTPLWRSMTKGGTVTPNRMNRVDVFRMIKRRVRQAELGVAANCHTFRATGITAYLLNGGTVENAQAIAAHESPRTTKLYDRTADEISASMRLKGS